MEREATGRILTGGAFVGPFPPEVDMRWGAVVVAALAAAGCGLATEVPRPKGVGTPGVPPAAELPPEGEPETPPAEEHVPRVVLPERPLPVGKHDPQGPVTPPAEERVPPVLPERPSPVGDVPDGSSRPTVRRPGVVEPFELPPLQTDVPHYELEIDPAALAEILADVDEDILKPATFVFQGTRQPVQLRLRGNSSRDWPKKSWRVVFPDTAPFEGRRKLNLVSGWRDQSLQVEKLGYDLLAAMHVPASRAKYVRVTINGEYQGVYLDLERVDKDFARARFADPDPNIYRCGRKDCEMKLWRAGFQHEWEKETNELDPSQADLVAFLTALHEAPEPLLPETLERILELESYLRMMVAEALFSNDTIEDSRSYMVHDAVTGRWFYAPWDYNNSTTKLQPGSDVGKQADVDQPLWVYSITDSWSELEYQKRIDEQPEKDWHALFSDLSTRIQLHPELRTRLEDRLDQALATIYSVEVLGPRFEAIHALLRPYVVTDPYVELALFDYGPDYMKQFVAGRSVFLSGALAAERAAGLGVVLAEIDPGAGRVTIANLGDAPVSLDGWVLTGNLRRRPAVPSFPAGTVLEPGARLALDATALGLTAGAIGEVGLFRGPAVDDVVDALYFGPTAAGKRWARATGAPERWELVE